MATGKAVQNRRVSGSTATARRAGASSGRKKASRKKSAKVSRGSSNGRAKKPKLALKKAAARALSRKKTVVKKPKVAALGRPRVAGTAELELMFRNDREAREICEFLGVRTLKELEALSPAEILERLTAPVVRTLGRIRKALAINNRCLAGDQKFAVAFKKQLR